MIGWDHPDTARYYSAFERRHRRYRSANRALVQQAALLPGLRVLDFAAGSGGTTAEILPWIGKDGRVDCVEPAGAMRAAGRPRFDARVRWLAELPDRHETYDRILCGAAIWQLPDLQQCLEDLTARLAPGGALSFNIPAAYLGLADRPGGGRDPWLVELPSVLASRLPAPGAAPDGSWTPLTARGVATLLRRSGLLPRSWSHTGRLSQAAYRDWLKLPVVSNGLLGQLNADDRAAALDTAFEKVDQGSWRWERWIGWTAWKPQFPVAPFAADRPDADADWPRRMAVEEGCVYLPKLLPARQVLDVRRRILSACAGLGLADLQGRWRGGPQPFGGGSPEQDPGWLALQREALGSPAFQALGRDPRLIEILEQMMRGKVLPEQGSVCRLMPPNASRLATPPHRDQDYIRHSAELWTAWIPLGRCPVLLGPLAVAPGSHREPLLAPSAGMTWSTGDLEPGDVLLFSGRTLHRACPNLSRDRVRLSADFRFCPAE